jgi:hypothetical protein
VTPCSTHGYRKDTVLEVSLTHKEHKENLAHYERAISCHRDEVPDW